MVIQSRTCWSYQASALTWGIFLDCPPTGWDYHVTNGHSMQNLLELPGLCPDLESIFLDCPPPGWGQSLLTNKILNLSKIKANKVLYNQNICINHVQDQSLQ
jgi:hypothetical protein